jgi:integrase
MNAQKSPGQIFQSLPEGKFERIDKIINGGTLEARKLTTGIMLAWRVTVAGKTQRFAIGLWDNKAPPKTSTSTAKGFTLVAAKMQAEVWAKLHKDNIAIGGYPGLLAKQEADNQKAAQAVIDTKATADAAKQASAKYNLGALLADYCDYIEGLGRRSFSDATSIFRLHVFEAWPQLTATPAKDITEEDVADMMRRLIEADKARTSNKLRSYLRAAYEVAKAAKSKPSIPLKFKAYGVRNNPAADTYADPSANKTDKNPLSGDEMRTYWNCIKPMPGFIGAALRLHLLTGGLRIEQLCALMVTNVTPDSITLFDSKGKPGQGPRPYTVPLIDAAGEAMRALNPAGVFAISTDGGKTHLAATTLSRWSVAAATGIENFQAKRIRSGVETLLASLKISSDIRGRLQSHGISGVQARHYDGYEYVDEKRHALETLYAALEGSTINQGSNLVKPTILPMVR